MKSNRTTDLDHCVGGQQRRRLIFCVVAKSLSWTDQKFPIRIFNLWKFVEGWVGERISWEQALNFWLGYTGLIFRICRHVMLWISVSILRVANFLIVPMIIGLILDDAVWVPIRIRRGTRRLTHGCPLFRYALISRDTWPLFWGVSCLVKWPWGYS